MAVTELDHDAIKERIKVRLEAVVALFDANDLTKIRAIEVGFPEGDPFDPENMDHIYISNAVTLESITPAGNSSDDEWKSLRHIVRYEIVTIVNASTAREAEEKLDDFQKLILEELEENPQLKTGAGADPLVHVCWPERVDVVRQGAFGTPVQGRKITLRCQVDTGV